MRSHNYSVCFSEPGPAKYILVTTRRSWLAAQDYCRSHYTDLASVRNMSEFQNISTLVSAPGAWIGLHRIPWQYWSDGTITSFTNWEDGEPKYSDRNVTCVSFRKGRWFNRPCDDELPYVCQTFSVVNSGEGGSPSSQTPPPSSQTPPPTSPTPPPSELPSESKHHRLRLKMKSATDLRNPVFQDQLLQQVTCEAVIFCARIQDI